MSYYTRLAQTDIQENMIVKIEQWLAKHNAKIVGAVTIGKHPQTVILDLTYQGGEIYVNSDGDITLFDEPVDDYHTFIEIIRNYLRDKKSKFPNIYNVRNFKGL